MFNLITKKYLVNDPVFIFFTKTIFRLAPLKLTCARIPKTKLYSRFGRHYEIPLLIQSILMTLAMLALIRVCVQVAML
jgi:hypothetical protein